MNRVLEHRFSRRAWLAGMAAMAGTVARGATSGERQLLMIWLDGGLSQLESWDPKPGTRFGGPFRSIQTAVPGIRYSELLPKTAGHAAKIAVARNMSTQDNSHSAGVARIQRGDPKNRGVDYPYLNVAAARWLVGRTGVFTMDDMLGMN